MKKVKQVLIKFLSYLISILQGNYKVIDIWYYIQGNVRYKIINSSFRKLIRKHVKEQIELRISNMNKECYNNGECVMCGCATTALQMCDKSCEGLCYPRMMSRKEWLAFKDGDVLKDGEYYWVLNDFVLVKGKDVTIY
jgi:hypothetical protein